MLYLVKRKKVAEHIKEFFAMKSLNKCFSISLCNVSLISNVMIHNRVVIPTNGCYQLMNCYKVFPTNETIGSFIKAT